MTPTTPRLPDGCTVVREVPDTGLPALLHPGWAAAFPWLAQGITVRGDESRPFDLGLFAVASPARHVLEAWERLRLHCRFDRVVHAHQSHGATVRVHGPGAPGLHLAAACDGHATGVAGVLLAVSVADCVPVSLVAPGERGVALLHAGWRGTAAGILERGVAVLGDAVGCRAEDLVVHLGPAICGSCYEVGPEVFQGLGLPSPRTPSPVDLRAALARRAVAAGVAAANVSVSSHCTLCGTAGLFSHRGGDGERQVAYLGVGT